MIKFLKIELWASALKFLCMTSNITLWIISRTNAVLTVLSYFPRATGPRERLRVFEWLLFHNGIHVCTGESLPHPQSVALIKVYTGNLGNGLRNKP